MMVIVLVFLASLAFLASCLQVEPQFVGCFLYSQNLTTIHHGKYIPTNLSKITCYQECQATLIWTSSLALAEQRMCLCDNNLEDFERTEKVEDERCRSKCKASTRDTEYCGQIDTMAVYAVISHANCSTFPKLNKAIMTFNISTEQFQCKEGYTISGDDRLFCHRVNGSWEWNGSLPKCIDDRKMETFALPTVLGILFTILIVVLASGGIAYGYHCKRRKTYFLQKQKSRIEQIYGEHTVNDAVSGNLTSLTAMKSLSPDYEPTGYAKYENTCYHFDPSKLPPTPEKHFWYEVCDKLNSEHQGNDVEDFFSNFVDTKYFTDTQQVDA